MGSASVCEHDARATENSVDQMNDVVENSESRQRRRIQQSNEELFDRT